MKSVIYRLVIKFLLHAPLLVYFNTARSLKYNSGFITLSHAGSVQEGCIHDVHTVMTKPEEQFMRHSNIAASLNIL